jgi:ATP-binding cassette subfamily F protein uup
MADGSKITASQFLTRFHFPPPAQQQKIGNLSGGEKRRVQLMVTLLKNPNFLILDEPSNDFDINTLHVLEEFLQDFPGTLLLVSHDRFLLDKLVSHLFVFKGNGEVADFPGNYSQWKQAEEEKAEKDKAEKNTQAVRTDASENKTETKPTSATGKLSFREKQELEELDLRIPELENRKKEIETELGSGKEISPDLLNRLIEELGQLDEQIDLKSMRWLELSERR